MTGRGSRKRRYGLNEESVHELIKLSYFKGCSVEKTFYELCRQFGSYFDPTIDEILQDDSDSEENENGYSESSINQIFSYLFQKNKDNVLCPDYYEEYYKIKTKIDAYYQMLKSVIFYGPEYSDFNSGLFEEEIKYLSGPRYSVKYNDSTLIVFDHFHGQKSNFPIVDPKFGFHDKRTLHHNLYKISQDLFIFCQEFEHSQYYDFYLMQIDFEQKECHVLDWNSTGLVFIEFILGLENKNEFIFIYASEDETNYYYLSGQLKSNKILFNKEDKNPILIRDKIQSSKAAHCQFALWNSKLHYLEFGDDVYNNNFQKEGIQIDYIEFDLVKNESKTVFDLQLEFENEERVDFDRFYDTDFAWTPNKICYFNVRNHQNNFCSFYALNVNTQTCVPINFTCKMYYAPLVEDDILIAKDVDAVYRYSFRHPDSLKNLTWFKIRRLLMFNGKQRLYDEAMKNLSLSSSLQPFSCQ